MSEEWDLFIAHSGAGTSQVEELYEKLASHCRVFLDSKCLFPGDDWDSKLTEAQGNARISVIVVSANTPRSYYQREEIAAAIDMARTAPDSHRVVPVYLEDVTEDHNPLPYGLRIKHGIFLHKEGSIDAVAQILLDLLDRLNKECHREEAEAKVVNSRDPGSSFLSRRNRRRVGLVVVVVGLTITGGIWTSYKFGFVPELSSGSYSCIVEGRAMSNCNIFRDEKDMLKLRFLTPEHGSGGFQDSFVGPITKRDECYLVLLTNTFSWERPPREGSETSELYVCPNETNGWSGTWKSLEGFQRQFDLRKKNNGSANDIN